MVVRKIIKKILDLGKSPNKYLNSSNWEYQQKLVAPALPDSGIIMDIGSGHNPVPNANILADFYPEDTIHRAASMVEDRPVIVCSVDRVPMLDKSIDFVICSHIVEHVDSPIRAGNELARIAKAGYIETPAFGKDIIVGTGDMHKWQIVEFEGVMHFFEYSDRQREAHTTSPAMRLWISRNYHPWQDFFWDRQDLFNAMHLWENQPEIREYRRAGSSPTSLKPWVPVSESLLPQTKPLLTPAEIDLVSKCLATPDGRLAMNFRDGEFVSPDGNIRYPVRGKRIYFEMANDK
ncbi:methyltransferase domain-containing protein [Flavitalea antarctica]